ncbi:hypothetical protein V527_29045 [Pseudomonas aeruginosa VRFPA06]|nr:hypothetical protein V527_29045 [Pseudomonas aeruginosa VRFPA06]
MGMLVTVAMPLLGFCFGHQMHLAFGAAARAILPDLRVHGTHVHRAGGCYLSGRRTHRISRGIGDEFFSASGAAKSIGLAVVLFTMR